MRSIYNKASYRDRRQILRASQTRHEALLWYRLRNKQLAGLRFFRQYSVGSYILDFYCPHLCLAIEVDGDHHSQKESVVYDQEREQYLASLDITTICFWNYEIMNDIENVMKRIKNSFPLKVRGIEGVTRT